MKALMDLMKSTEETEKLAKESLSATVKPVKKENKEVKKKAAAVMQSFTQAATETASKILVKHGIAGEPTDTKKVALKTEKAIVKKEAKKDDKKKEEQNKKIAKAALAPAQAAAAAVAPVKAVTPP